MIDNLIQDGYLEMPYSINISTVWIYIPFNSKGQHDKVLINLFMLIVYLGDEST